MYEGDMMSNVLVKNIIIIFNEYFYKEIDLDSYRKEKIIIGNTEDCDIKINVKRTIPFKFYFFTHLFPPSLNRYFNLVSIILLILYTFNNTLV